MRKKEMAIAIEKLQVRLAAQARQNEEARFRSAKAVQTVYSYEARFAVIEAALNIPEPRWGSPTIHPVESDDQSDTVTITISREDANLFLVVAPLSHRWTVMGRMVDACRAALEGER